MIILWRLSQTVALHKLSKFTILFPKRPVVQKIIKRMNSEEISLRPNITARTEQKARFADGVPDHCILIYRSKMTRIMSICYHLSYLIVLGGLAGVYYTNWIEKESYPIAHQQLGIQYNTQTERTLTYCGIIIMNLILFMFCRVHVARIWYDQKLNKYIVLVVNGLPPSLMKRFEVKDGDVSRKYKRFLNAFSRAAHIMNGRTYHIIESNFKTPSAYEKLLGDNFW